MLESFLCKHEIKVYGIRWEGVLQIKQNHESQRIIWLGTEAEMLIIIA